MYISTSLSAVLAVATTAQAFQLSEVAAAAADIKRSVSDAATNLFSRAGGCPSVWNDVSSTLTSKFLSGGQCTDSARAAIRAAFHDCFNGACDGSLILAKEYDNSENNGLQSIGEYLGDLASEKDVGVADLIQFAAAHAIKTCPGGPTVPVKVGRKDSSTANPTGVLPAGNAAAADLIKLFASKGFSAIDLAALVGAHSTAKQFTTVPSQAGTALDSTPGEWDVKFYSETIDGDAPFTLQADANLAKNTITGASFKTFANSQGLWAGAFVPAMAKLSMMGVSGAKLTDCTSALPGGSSKRDVKRSNLFDRLKL